MIMSVLSMWSSYLTTVLVTQDFPGYRSRKLRRDSNLHQILLFPRARLLFTCSLIRSRYFGWNETFLLSKPASPQEKTKGKLMQLVDARIHFHNTVF